MYDGNLLQSNVVISHKMSDLILGQEIYSTTVGSQLNVGISLNQISEVVILDGTERCHI